MFGNTNNTTNNSNNSFPETNQQDDISDRINRLSFNQPSRPSSILQSSAYHSTARSLDENQIAVERSLCLRNSLYKKTIAEIEGVFNFYKYCIDHRKDELVKEVVETYANAELNGGADVFDYCQFRQPDLQTIQSFVKSNFGYIEHKPPAIPLKRFSRATFNRSGSHGSSVQNDNCSVKSLSMRLRRQKIMYSVRIGQFGSGAGQFTEPSGIAVNGNDDILVADTNNHRIQVFSKEGQFLYQFGECGKSDGQLLYPNRVAVFKRTGEIVITERSPTHQVQVFSREGKFIRKFGSEVLQHPRGVCVDQRRGNIVVVECKVMRVFIFDLNGTILNRFTCAKLIEFPNAVAVNCRDEILISDNRSHCVKVFSYTGSFVRAIGAEGITNFPIAIGIEGDGNGDVLVADNHNSFNLTVFSSQGNLKNAFESKIRHAQCYDAALMSNGCFVLSSKDYHVYVYRYKNE